MEVEILREIGLTEGEIKVYKALFSLGKSSTGAIMRESNISSSKIYLILDKLIDKGLVSYIIENNVHYYENTSPRMLLNYLEAKKSSIEEQKKNCMPLIEYFENMEQKTASDAKVYRGIKGIKLVHDEILEALEEGEEYCVITTSEIARKMKGYWDEHNEKRISKKIKMKVLFDKDYPDLKKFKNMKSTSAKIFRTGYKTPSWIVVYRDIVIVASLSEPTILFYLQNKGTAESYREFFEVLWKDANKIQ